MGGVRLSPPSRKRQRGVKVGLMNERIGKSATTTEHLRSSRYWGCQVPHAKHSPRLSVRFTTTGASPTLPIYIVPSAQCRCSFAPICLTRLPGRTEARPYRVVVSSARLICRKRGGCRVAACCDLPGDGFFTASSRSHRGVTLRPRLPGRTKARPY